MANLGTRELMFKFFRKIYSFQLNKLQVPEIFWRILHYKCTERIFDPERAFAVEVAEPLPNMEELSDTSEDILGNSDFKVCVTKNDGVSPKDRTQIYVLKHAFTYALRGTRSKLLSDDNIRQRVAKLVNIDVDDYQPNIVVDAIFHDIFKFSWTYEIRQPKYSLVRWYILDEFGSKIRHSNKPSFRIVPFIVRKREPIKAFTLLFPIKEVPFGGEVTVNYIQDLYNDEITYQILMHPWKERDFTHIDYRPLEPSLTFTQVNLNNAVKLPDDQSNAENNCIPNKKIRVYAEWGIVRTNLKHPRFEIVPTKHDANILWLISRYKEFRELSKSPLKYINQFPLENLLTSKHLLPIIGRLTTEEYILNEDTLSTNPPWLATTYNLQTELDKFISYWQQREKKNLDNIWICKPFSLARGMGIFITDHLGCILKLQSTLPKVVCKYITDPVLFPFDEVGLVKMDFRYYVLVKSIKPLELYVYKKFLVRFANEPFSLEDFENYQKHFTVMNYCGKTVKQMYCHKFIEKFDEYYSPHKWEAVEAEIFSVLKNVFTYATLKPPPNGIFQHTQSRALYGIDVMLKWDQPNSDLKRIQPVLIEINFAPDCTRACRYYPAFFNDSFEVLFLDEKKNPNVVLL